MELKNSLTKSFAALKEISEENLEVFLDSMIDSEIVKEIPIIKNILGLWNFSNKLGQNFEIRKILLFLKEQNTGGNFDSIVESIYYHDEYSIFVEEILQILSRQDDLEKAKIIGKMFKSLLHKKITRDEYLLLTKIIEKSILSDFRIIFLEKQFLNDLGPILKDMSYSQMIKHRSSEELSMYFRLQNLGIIISKNYVLKNNEEDAKFYGEFSSYTNYFLSNTGKIILTYI